MKLIKIVTDTETLKLEIPENWSEINVAQFVRLEAEDWNGIDLIHLLSILSGKNLRKLDNVKDPKLFDALGPLLSFVAGDPPDFQALQLKPTFKINGRDLQVPRDLNLERIGQKILINNLLLNENVTKQIPQALAIYFQPIYDQVEKFDRRRIPAITKHIERTPIIEAFPIVNFFFLKLTKFKKNGGIALGAYR